MKQRAFLLVLSLALPFALVLGSASLFEARAQEGDTLNYPAILHHFWRMAPPKSYDVYADSYAEEFPENAGASREETAKNIQSLAGGLPEDARMTLRTHVMIGPYVKKREAFAFSPFESRSRFTVHPGTRDTGNLPTIYVTFDNAARIRALNIGKDAAEVFGTGMKGPTRIFADVDFIPQSADQLGKTLKARIVGMTLHGMGTRAITVSFDPQTGDITDAQLLDEAQAAPEATATQNDESSE